MHTSALTNSDLVTQIHAPPGLVVPIHPSSNRSSVSSQESAEDKNKSSNGDEGSKMTTLSKEENAQLEADKRTIYKHPLFPLLALLFEKCEVATQSIECPSTENFNADVKVFVEQHQKDRKPFLSDSDEANELMIKSIQVLRIHLLELEKVQELCKDFCTRYITCLKGKMQSENLLRNDYGGYDSDENSGGGPLSSSSRPSSAMAASGLMQPQAHNISNSATSSMLNMCQSSQPFTASGNSGNVAFSSAEPSFQFSLDQPSQQLVLQQQMFSNQPLFHSQFAQSADLNGSSVSTNFDQIAASILSDDFDDDSGSEENKSCKTKLGSLPKQSTAVLKAWLFQHLVHPYPNEEEKVDLSRQTGLNLSQVNNWFINARRRILHPTMEANVLSDTTNPNAGSSKLKQDRAAVGAKKSQNTAQERFWIENVQGVFSQGGKI